MSDTEPELPPLRGVLRRQVPLAPLTWLRVGGPAAVIAYPLDGEDLAAFLKALDPAVPAIAMGAASNLLFRDAGFDGVVVRFGGALAEVRVEKDTIIAGAGALVAKLAQIAARAGRGGLEFMVGIPGTVGGAARMNAGAFGAETADALLWVEVLDREGRQHRCTAGQLGFGYRHSELSSDRFVLRAAFRTVAGDAEALAARLAAIRAEREASQPLRVATGGSTFKNPPGLKAWRLIDRAGCRGMRFGRAAVSEKHCNFLINMGGAAAGEIEALGEEVRARVRVTSGIGLEWEIVRVGDALPVELAA